MTRASALTALLLLLPTACDQGSVGEFEATDGSGETEGEATAGSTGGQTTSAASTTGASSSATASGTSASATTEDTSVSGSTSTEGGETTGPLGVCDGIDNHMCSSAVDCGDACGTLDSMFDENGCVRPVCDAATACDDGLFCYRPQDYGGCQSSDVSCVEDPEGTCGCGLDPDCGGAYCVPEAIVFGGIAPGPIEGLVESGCGPADEPLLVLMVGDYASNACGGDFDPGPLLSITLPHPSGIPGTYTSANQELVTAEYTPAASVDPFEPAEAVVLRVSSWDGTVTGDYEVLLADGTLLVGTFGIVTMCEDPGIGCG
ncbi:MAG: hypothetical protein AAGA54_36885 [Myxococcota bacterium]